jgi:hypothetical protein
MANGSNPTISVMEVFQMPKFSFTSENMPTPEEFQHMLAEAMAKSNPLDELLELTGELRELEQKYGMTSAEFCHKYERGEMGDDAEIMHWAATYHTFVELKARVESALMREAVYREMELAAS